jgi:uncharacterized protein (TIGR00661 family)
MKILYGVQGTGNGHITRARIMAKALAKEGIAVDWVFSGRPDNDYFDMACFGNYRTFRGLTFVIKNGKVNRLKSALSAKCYRLYSDIQQFDLSGYDLIINDFEPITAWAAKRQNKVSIGLSHQNAFRYSIPKQRNSWIAEAFMRWFAPVTIPLGLHWHHFNNPILPPIIDVHPPPSVHMSNHILVYFPFLSVTQLCRLLRPFTDHHFYVYHAIEKPEDRGHIHLRPFSREGFAQDLQQASGVVCGAGFELPSEAIHLGKKLLVQPVAGQMEQASNALALEQLGLASVTYNLRQQDIAQWLAKESGTHFCYPDTATAVVHWIKQGRWEQIDELVNSLWQQTSLSMTSSQGKPLPLTISP